jgi:membrane dipeptidase
MTLTHSNANNWADSSGARPRHNGLTEFGREVVQEMNRLGMIVDISHVSDKTFWDVLSVSKAPVFASHSSARALAGIARNMTDEMIRALAEKGGVVQINFGCDFVSQASADARRAKRKVPRAKLEDVVAHIEHVVKVAGIDAVGLGSDFDGVDCVPIGLDDVSQFPNLTRALLERGYTAEQIQKIYGGNTLRLMRAVEQATEAMRKRTASVRVPGRRAHFRRWFRPYSVGFAAFSRASRKIFVRGSRLFHCGASGEFASSKAPIAMVRENLAMFG